MSTPFAKLYADTDGFKDLKEHLEAFVERHAVKRALAREDVSGVADAKEIIDAAFDDLEEKFGKKDPLPPEGGRSSR